MEGVLKQCDAAVYNDLMEYEKQILLDTFHDDGLLLMARGLGLERIFISFLKLYSDPANLVLVINTSPQEEDYFLEKLREQECKPLPKVITTSYSIGERERTYLEGGVQFITSRILVVDFLTNRIPVHLITGILVYNAQRVIDSCQEAFILRLYRQGNANGFIKAFTSSPAAFTTGFCQVERVMKSLFVRKLFLWPRFHASVVSYFDNHKVDVVELHIKMTPSMLACQMSLLDIIEACVKELKICNPSLETEDITVENAISRGFDKIIRQYFDQVWHQLGPKTKQLIADIKTLRLVLEYLTQYDSVSFYNMVYSLRTSEKVFGSNSGWLFMDAADSLFVHAKERVFGPMVISKKQKTESEASKTTTPSRPPLLEQSPKWEALKDVLSEIETANEDEDTRLGTGRVLLVAQDDRTCSQIKEYLCDGPQSLLTRLFNKTLVQKGENPLQDPLKSKCKFSKGKGPGKGKAPKDNPTLTQMSKGASSTGDDDDSAKKDDDDSNDYYGVLTSPMTVLHALHGNQDKFSILRVLQELQPTYVIMYDTDIDFVRQIEVFKASRPGYPLRVYFLMYTGSTEEQKYLTTLRKEKEAFETLIREKATMVIPEERDGRFQNDPSLARDVTPANATTNTRKGGAGEVSKETRKVVVDVREFRSELPSLIHRRGIEIEPVTIEVGDYILTPDMCVERKSVSDLIGSLNNGRLYNQCVSMCRFYKRPILLIEFDPNKPFALMGKSSMYGEMNTSDVQSRLALLTLHFPRLRILWTQSPYVTAELVEDLKVNRPEPNSAAAMAVTGEREEDLTSGKYSHNPREVLLRMPGVNTRNVFALMNKVENLAELVTLSEERLAELIGNAPNARLLHQFLHTEASSAAVNEQGHGKKKYFTKGFKRRR